MSEDNQIEDEFPLTHEDEAFLDEEISLVSSEESTHIVTRREACLSKLLFTIMDADQDAGTIDLPHVQKDVLDDVIVYLRQYNGEGPPEIEKPIRSTVMKDIATEWEAEYIERFSIKRLYKVILAAHYLDIPTLVDLGCAKVASLIRGKSPDEIKDILQGGNGDSVEGVEDNSEHEL